eukprot:341494_1
MSDLVIADLYKGDFIYNISDEEWLKRLEYVSICEPLKYKLTDTALGKFILNRLFNDNGCFVYDYTNESVVCACRYVNNEYIHLNPIDFIVHSNKSVILNQIH